MPASLPSRLVFPLLTSLAMLGCNGGTDEDTADPQDTDPTTDSIASYEEGCLTSTGATQSFKFLEDAISASSDGAVITLCQEALDGLSQTVVIDRGIVLQGPGDGSVVWTAPVSFAAARITGAGGAVQGVTINSTRSAVEIDGAAAATVQDNSFTGAGSSVIRVLNSRNVLISNNTFDNTQSSGVFFQTSEGELRDNTFISPVGYALKLEDGASALAANNTITDWTYSPVADGEGVSDGYAFWAIEESTLTTEGNLFTGIADGDTLSVVAVLGDEATLNLSGDTITGGYYGVAGFFGPVALDGLTITDAYFYGVQLLSDTDNFIINNSVITGTHGSVDDGVGSDIIDRNGNIAADSTAVFAATDGLLEMSQTSLLGYDFGGLIVLPYDNQMGVNLTEVTLNDNRTWGIWANGIDGAFSNTSVTNLGVNSPPIVDFTLVGGTAAYLANSLVSWTGGALTGSAAMGIFSSSTALDISNVTMDNNLFAHIYAASSTVVATNNSFSHNPTQFDDGAGNSYGTAGVFSIGGTTSLQGNTFNDSQGLVSYEYDLGTYIYRQDSYYSGQDIYSSQDNLLEVIGNTFTKGSQSIFVYDTQTALISDNTWSDYVTSGAIVYLYQGEVTMDVEMIDNTASNINGYFLNCQNSSVEIDGLTLTTLPGAKYAYDIYYDGVFQYGYSGEYAVDAIYGYICDAQLSNVDITDVSDHPIYFYESVVELVDVEIEAVGRGGSTSGAAVYLTYASLPPDVLIRDLDIQDVVNGHGVLVEFTGAGSSFGGAVDIGSAEISGAGASGIYLEDLADFTVTLSDITSSNNGDHGVYIDGSLVEASNVNTETNADHGIYGTGALKTAYDSGGKPYTYWADVGGFTLEGGSALNNGGDGVNLLAIEGALSDMISTGNRYGVACTDAATLTVCTNLDLTGNLSGENNGCGCL